MKISKFFSLSAISFLSAVSAFADTQTVVVMSAKEADRRAAAEEAAQIEAEIRKMEADWFTKCAQKGLVPHDQALRGRYYDWLKQNSKIMSRARELRAVDILSNGDAIALDRIYDDQATIRTYLHDSGYDLSDTEISKISTYMKANHIYHISELGL